MLLIQLKNSNDTAMVDDEDFGRLSQWQWLLREQPNGDRYVVRYENQRTVFMHREILGAPDVDEIDHRDGDGLNNCKYNLRICSHAQNMRNRKKHRNGRSQFKGVYYDSRRDRWRAQIRLNNKKFMLGDFQDEEGAARAYDEAASRLHGEFARLNFAASVSGD